MALAGDDHVAARRPFGRDNVVEQLTHGGGRQLAVQIEVEGFEPTSTAGGGW
jgi:hypothetical protein